MKALTRLIQTTRRFSASSVCMRSEGVWQQKGVPGKTLPLNINSRPKLFVTFLIFFGSGLAAPFLLVRYQMLKT